MAVLNIRIDSAGNTVRGRPRLAYTSATGALPGTPSGEAIEFVDVAHVNAFADSVVDDLREIMLKLFLYNARQKGFTPAQMVGHTIVATINATTFTITAT